MTQNSNQFAMSPEKAQLILGFDLDTFNCRVKSDEATPLVPGQKVKLVDTDEGIFVVTAAIATDEGFGFIPYNIKKNSYAAGEEVKVAADGSIMLMEAGAAIAPQAKVESVATGQKVIASAGVNVIEGVCLDKASADGDFVRVWIKSMNIVQPVTFLTLPDTPGAYSASDTLKVNAGATAVEFVTV